MKRYMLIATAVLAFVAAGSLSAQMMGRGQGRYGWGPGTMGPGMMGGWDYIPPDGTEPITIDEAVKQVERYLESWDNPDLKLAEVMEFSKNYYAEIEEESTGVHAFELLVDKYTGQVFPEPGPNMMWNAKYGHMGGGMMGGGCCGAGGGSRGSRRIDPAEPMKVKPEQAVKSAQRYLDSLYPGIKADSEVDRFYGYYTIHTLKDGKVYGMLSVNGYTGEVWYHTWHGRFVGMKEYEGEEHG